MALSGAINSIPALVRNTIKIFSQVLLKETGDDNIAAATVLLTAVSKTVGDVIPGLVDKLITSETWISSKEKTNDSNTVALSIATHMQDWGLMEGALARGGCP
jgi:hypothetical protein